MSQTPAPRLAVTSIELSERRVPFRTPFRFGAVTVNEAAQLFVHVAIDVDGKASHGASAELMVPKWFNKDPGLSADETVEQLRQSARTARGLYLDGQRRDTAFGLHAACYPAQAKACAEAGIPALAAAFGPAEIDKAILDALLRATGQNAFTGFAANTMGLDPRLTPDLDQSAIDAFLTGCKPSAQIALRHTVGMVDPIDSVREAAGEGYRYFKLKLCGDPQKDRARLADIATALDDELGDTDYRATADANEQYGNAADLGALLDALADPVLAGLARRLLYIEQPFARDITWNTPLGALAERARFIIDEADDSYDTFPRARALGYRGCSTKSCKGLYKSLLNGARAAQWNKAGGDYFISAEDLTCQPGLAVQQDTALVAFHGLTHAERNGHHYVDGFAGTPDAEARAFLAAHPDLYAQSGGSIHLKVENGAIPTGSLAVSGFASALAPDQVGPHHPSRPQGRTNKHNTEFAS
jgi:hypothetical protein